MPEGKDTFCPDISSLGQRLPRPNPSRLASSWPPTSTPHPQRVSHAVICHLDLPLMITSVWQLINPTSAMDQSAGLLSDTAELEPPLSSIYLSETPPPPPPSPPPSRRSCRPWPLKIRVSLISHVRSCASDEPADCLVVGIQTAFFV